MSDVLEAELLPLELVRELPSRATTTAFIAKSMATFGEF
jgi:hypothetical protein